MGVFFGCFFFVSRVLRELILFLLIDADDTTLILVDSF